MVIGRFIPLAQRVLPVDLARCLRTTETWCSNRDERIIDLAPERELSEFKGELYYKVIK